MFTKWGKIYAGTPLSPNNPVIPRIAHNDTIGNCVIPLKNYAGDTKYGLIAAYSVSTDLISSGTGAGFVVGSGSTPATENDYKLDNLISGLTGSVSSSTVYDSETFSYAKQIDITLSNTTQNDITVSEVGRLVTVRTAATRGSNYSDTEPILIFRSVLDTPIVVPAGEASVLRLLFKYPSE